MRCCGEDILACAPVPVDLTGCCADDDPCGEPSYPQKKHPCGDFVVDLELEAEEVPAVTELVDPCGCGGGCSSLERDWGPFRSCFEQKAQRWSALNPIPISPMPWLVMGSRHSDT